MAIAICIPPERLIDVKTGFDGQPLPIRVTPGDPFTCSGSAWSGGRGGFTKRAKRDAHARDAVLDFAMKK